jgi:hypothetical protein
MKYIKIFFTIVIAAALWSCKKFLDVVPDNIATIDNAFTQRSSAEKYLFTCYSYMPKGGDFNLNPGFTGGDEVWYMYPALDVKTNFWRIARGEQNITSPLGNFWSGKNDGQKLFQGLRDCNIFLDNIGKVKDLDEYERERWIAEVKFLKAYYHFYLVRMYGPIPLVKENLPISSTTDEIQVYRDPVDSCFNYIVQLLDEAAGNNYLPDRIIGTESTELGRTTKAIVLAVKSRVLVTAASPLFNGNTDFANLKDDQGRQLFNQTNENNKWAKAADACKDAIDFCTANGYALYHFPGAVGYVVSPAMQIELDIRTAVTEKYNNTEVIWPNASNRARDVQRWSMPLIAPGTSGSGPKGIIAPPLKMAELFYTKNGVPITEDIAWDYPGRYNLKTATAADKYYIKQNEQTVKLHFDREPRFYANLSFDRGVWFGNWVGNYNSDSLYFIKARKGETAARQGVSNFSATGYWVKKLVGLTTTAASDGALTTVDYPWPEFRLADLYLLYAEALNEVSGPNADVYSWIDLVRARAGLKTVEISWSTYSRFNTKHKTKVGLREIIHQERLIELAFEAQRFWDLRRWKEAHIVLNAPIKGWDMDQTEAPAFYKEVILFNQTFGIRDYFWPIELDEILRNRKLVQNTGW